MSDAIAADGTLVTERPAPSAWAGRLERVEQFLASASDRLNPILVKETRQALKSRQFGFTFVLLLIFCWVITIGGVALAGPGIYYSAAGAVLLKAYFWVLIFPLAVVVPFTAFRSLSSEREENTYDLLRVSTLTPPQIIRGKLGSAVVQMGVYLSAVAPCIAFTYLLRGVDVATIAVLLTYATLGSLGLSMVGLFAAAMASKKHGQVLLSVGFVTMLLGCFWSGLILANEFLDYGGRLIRDDEFWLVSGLLFTIYATTFALVYFAAVGLVSYRSENRSTPLRWVMVVQQTAFIAWMAFFFIAERYEDGVLIVSFVLAALYWYGMGTLLSTEAEELSHRVRRSLPQSGLGRLMLSLFNPGPGTGYLFAIANLTSLILLIAIAMTAVYSIPLPARRNFHYEEIGLVMVTAWSYIVIYLGLGKLLTASVRRFAPVTGVAGFLIHFLLVLAGSGIPYAIQMSSRTWRNAGYTMLQWPNPFWTLEEMIDGPGTGGDVWLQAMVMFGVALSVLVVNLPSIARELMQGRVALPERVAEDDAELHPPPAAAPQNPWDQATATD
jgi:ABC-type transport system involved in cytochrome c biogenesis permease component